MEKPNELVGKIIRSIYLSDDSELLKFETVYSNENGIVVDVIAQCEGDCCSYTGVQEVARR